MKIFIFLFTLFVSFISNSLYAQTTDKSVVVDSDAVELNIDSIMFLMAEKAVIDKGFTLEADKVEFKYGQTAFVNSNTNFVSVNGDNSVVQLAFNIPLSGPNGLGGITLDGKVSNYEVNKDKKGNVDISMNVMGTGISARVTISLFAGSNRASVTILPNFNSNRITLVGVIVPSQLSRVFKGSSI